MMLDVYTEMDMHPLLAVRFLLVLNHTTVLRRLNSP